MKKKPNVAIFANHQQKLQHRVLVNRYHLKQVD